MPMLRFKLIAAMCPNGGTRYFGHVNGMKPWMKCVILFY